MRYLLSAICLSLLLACASPAPEPPQVPQWATFEIELTATNAYANPYTELAVWGIFTSESGQEVRRPAFWDGGQSWKIRFAPPTANERWNWKTETRSSTDPGLRGQTGSLQSVPYEGENGLLQHGLLGMSPGKRNVIHSDGTPFLLVGDTPWALPFRATPAQTTHFAQDRQDKGFNAALLMTVQPDMEAEGPNARNTDQGFVRAFTDLSDGHINDLQPAYFQTLDTLMNILIDHEIVPVYQPVFHGFGWKGLRVLGTSVDPDEYVRYCRYLLARYGSQPAIWLIAGDHNGKDPGVKEAGEMLEIWDAYAQPTGLHYSPCDDYIAKWAKSDPKDHCEHYNQSFQAEPWLDFQWAQSGHDGEHLYHKVERMYANSTIKAAANGEPTYEGMNDGKNGLGWWQGEEAWMELMSGGTMGVVYGAASLWQWKVSAEEAGWTAWSSQAKSWEQALEMEGSTYVGLVGKILQKIDWTDIEKHPELTGGKHPLLAKPGELYVSFLKKGGSITIANLPSRIPYRWLDPRTGVILEAGNTDGGPLTAPVNQAVVLIVEQ